jgi:hypothetical protein
MRGSPMDGVKNDAVVRRVDGRGLLVDSVCREERQYCVERSFPGGGPPVDGVCREWTECGKAKGRKLGVGLGFAGI